MSTGFNLPNAYDRVKYITMDEKKRKKNQQETEDKLPRVKPSEQEAFKHILVAVDATRLVSFRENHLHEHDLQLSGYNI